MNLIKYFTSKTTYTYMRSSLSSIVKWFAALVWNSVDYLNQKNHSYKQHLIQVTYLLNWLPKWMMSLLKSWRMQQLESTQSWDHSLVADALFFCNINRTDGNKLYILYQKVRTFFDVVIAMENFTPATSIIYQSHS